MQSQQHHEYFDLPEKAAKELIAHAVRHISNKDKLLERCYPKDQKLKQMPDHVYSDTPHYQWNFMN